MPFPVTVKMDFKVAKNFFHLLSLKRNKIFSLCNCPFSQRKVKKMVLLKTSLIEPKKQEEKKRRGSRRKTQNPFEIAILQQQLVLTFCALLLLLRVAIWNLEGPLFYIRACLFKKLHYTHSNKES